MVEGHNEGKEYASLESLDKDSLDDLKSLEKKLTYKDFINGKIISIKDVETYENFMLLNVNLNKNDYPHILKWKNEIERMKLNWKISKKPSSQKGRTFHEYIEKMHEKIKQNDKIYSNNIKNLTNISKNIFENKEEKEIATIHFFKKKSENYVIKILIKCLNNNNLKYQDIASKLIIISHNYFPNKCVVEELKNEKDNNWINAVIITTINKNDYDIGDFSQDVKRNINNNIQVSILSIEENNNIQNDNNENNNNNNQNNNNIQNKEYVEIIK